MASNPLLSSLVRRLEGKVAMITGGASGVGECAARLFYRHGAKVTIADIQDELGLSVCQDIGSDLTTFVHCDVTKESDVSNAVDDTVAKYGKLDIMFNNAGIIDPPRPSILDNTQADFNRVMRVNVTGSFLGTKHAARVMAPAGRGSIIFTASVASVVGGSVSHAYVASKHAIAGLTKNAAVELGRYGIRVNCISPYGMATPFSRRYMECDDSEIERIIGGLASLIGVVLSTVDAANAALFLASDDSKYVSGHNLVIDGAFTAA